MSDILNMEAGRELDRLVAEKVMGWKLVNYETYMPAKTEADYADAANNDGWMWEGMAGDGEAWQWKPSTDISAAWQVWEKLRQSGEWCCLDIGSDYDYCYRVTLIPSNFDEKYEGKHEPTVTIDGEGSAPLAICKAALLAIGGTP